MNNILPRSKEAKLLLGVWSSTVAIATVQALINRRKKRKAKGSEKKSDNTERIEQEPKQSALKRALAIANPPSKRFYLGGAFLHGLALTASLCLDLFVSVKTSALIGEMGALMAQGEWDTVEHQRLAYALWTIPVAVLSATNSYLQSKLALALRSNLTENIHQQYRQRGGSPVFPPSISPAPSSSSSSIDDDTSATPETRGLGLVESRVTEDSDQLSTNLASIFRDLTTTSLQLSTVSILLAHRMGIKNLLKAYAYFLVAGAWGRVVTSGFEQGHVDQVAEEEARLQSHHTRLSNYREEIQLMQGAQAENALLTKCWNRICSLKSALFRSKFISDVVTQYTVRHMGTLMALSSMLPTAYRIVQQSSSSTNEIATQPIDMSATTPSFFSRLFSTPDPNKQDATEYFLSVLHLLVKVGMATRTLFGCFRQLSQAKQHAHRYMELHDALAQPLPPLFERRLSVPTEEHSQYSFHDILFDDVSICSPTGKLLLQHLSIKFKPGQSTLISGANGTGKTTLFRVLSGLWPVSGGTVTVPDYSSCFFLPQRPYLVPNITLREQLLYPSISPQKSSNGHENLQQVSEEEIQEALDFVGLSEWATDKLDIVSDLTMFDPSSSLGASGGQKQRIQIARLLLVRPRPRFAFLDEPTSALSSSSSFATERKENAPSASGEELHERLVQYCNDNNIALITISHKTREYAHLYQNHLKLSDYSVEAL